MQTYGYRATLEPGETAGVIVVTFADVPEAITQGDDLADALIQAEDALGVALLSYPLRGLRLPPAATDTGALVTVAPDVAAKLALLESFAVAGLSKSELARRIGCDEKEVRRLLDPHHPSKLKSLSIALAALGKRLVVGVEDVPAAA